MSDPVNGNWVRKNPWWMPEWWPDTAGCVAIMVCWFAGFGFAAFFYYIISRLLR